MKNQKGIVALMTALITMFTIATFSWMLILMIHVNMKSGLHNKLVERAVSVADVGVAQMITDIHRHEIDLDLLPVTTTYAISKDLESGSLETVDVTLDVVPDINDVDDDGNLTEPETNVAGHIVYEITSVSSATLATGARIATRTVSARISIINLASYNLFYVADDVWGNGSTLSSGTPIMLDGPYHTNGSLGLGGVIYFNNEYLPINAGSNNTPGGIPNPSYDAKCTVMSAGDIYQLSGGYPSNVTYTQNNQRGRLTNDANYDVNATPTHPRGTWFDASHRGFEIKLEPLDFVEYRNIAQVRIDIDDLPTFSVFGGNYSSSDLLIDTGAGFQAVEIDLSYIGTGLSKDITQGMTNYQNALTSEYGLVVFVKGPVAIHGKLNGCVGADTNKKITIITTDTTDIIGDILYSGDPYMQILDHLDVNPDIHHWHRTVTNAHCNLFKDTTPAGAQFKNIDNYAMRVRLDKMAANPLAIVSKNYSVVPPPAGIDNNKIYFNIKGDTAADIADVQLRLIGNSGAEWLSPTVTVDDNWTRVVLVGQELNSDKTLTLADLNDFNNNSADNLEIIFTNFDPGSDGNFRNFYIDEIGFAFGKSYPIDRATVNPTNDSIAIISQDNIYENPWYLYNISYGWEAYNWFVVPPAWLLTLEPAYYPEARSNSIRYFAVNGDYAVQDGYGSSDTLFYDLRMDAFMYTSITGSMFTTHTGRWLNMFSIYGAMTSNEGGSVRAPVFNNVHDRGAVNNISKAIPVGTVLHTWQLIR